MNGINGKQNKRAFLIRALWVLRISTECMHERRKSVWERARHSKTFVLYHSNSSVDESRYVFIATRKWERCVVPTARKIHAPPWECERAERDKKYVNKRYKSYSFLFHNALGARAQEPAHSSQRIIESLYLLYELTHSVSTVRARIIQHGRR